MRSILEFSLHAFGGKQTESLRWAVRSAAATAEWEKLHIYASIIKTDRTVEQTAFLQWAQKDWALCNQPFTLFMTQGEKMTAQNLQSVCITSSGRIWCLFCCGSVSSPVPQTLIQSRHKSNLEVKWEKWTIYAQVNQRKWSSTSFISLHLFCRYHLRGDCGGYQG